MNKFPFHPFFRYEVEYDEHRLAIAHEIGSRFLDIDVTTSMDNLNNGNTGIDADDNKNAINHDDGGEEDDDDDDDDDVDGRQCETKTNISIETENINKTPKTAAATATLTSTTATNPVETELCNNTTANNTSSSCSNNHKNFQHHNGDGGDGSSTVTYDGDGGGGGGRVVDGGGGDNNDEGGGGSIERSGSGIADDETTTAGTTTILVAKLNGNSNKTPLSASDEFVLDILNDDLISRVRNKINSGSKELFEPCVKAVKAFLAGEPFQEFETSMYFHR